MGGQKVSRQSIESEPVGFQMQRVSLSSGHTAQGGELGGLGHKLHWEAPRLISAQAYKGRSTAGG